MVFEVDLQALVTKDSFFLAEYRICEFGMKGSEGFAGDDEGDIDSFAGVRGP